MADEQKIFSIKIDGVDKSLSGMEKLGEAIKAATREYSQYDIEQKAIKEVEKERTRTLTQIAKMQSSQSGSIKEMTAALSLMRKQYDALSKAERESAEVGGKMLKQIQALDKELKTAKQETGRFQDNVGNYASALLGADVETTNFNKQLRSLRDQMQTLIANGISPTSEAYKQLEAQYLQTTEAQKQFNEQLSDAASRTSALDNIIGLGQTMTATYGAMNSAMALFGGESERVNEALKKSAAAFALINQLQTIQKNLMNTSTIEGKLFKKANDALTVALQKKNAAQKVANVTTKEGTVANAANTASLTAEAAATNGATAATAGLTAGMGLLKKAIITTGIGAVLILLTETTAAAASLTKNLSSGAREAKKFKESLDGIKLRNVTINAKSDIMKDMYGIDKSNFDALLVRLNDFYDEQVQAAGKNKEKIVQINKERNEAILKANEIFYNNHGLVGEDISKYPEQIREIITQISKMESSLTTVDKAAEQMRVNLVESTNALVNEIASAYESLNSRSMKSLGTLQDGLDDLFYNEGGDPFTKIKILLEQVNSVLDSGEKNITGKSRKFLEQAKAAFESVVGSYDAWRDTLNLENEILNDVAHQGEVLYQEMQDLNNDLAEIYKARNKIDRDFVHEHFRNLQENAKNEDAVVKKMVEAWKESASDYSNEVYPLYDEATQSIVGTLNKGLGERLEDFREYQKKMEELEEKALEREKSAILEQAEYDKAALKDRYDNGELTRKQYNEQIAEIDEQARQNLINREAEYTQTLLDNDKQFYNDRKKVIDDYYDYMSKKQEDIRKQAETSNYSGNYQSQIGNLGNTAAMPNNSLGRAYGTFDLNAEKERIGEIIRLQGEYRDKLNESRVVMEASYDAQIRAAEEARKATKEGSQAWQDYDNTIKNLVSEKNGKLLSIDNEIKSITNDIQESTYELEDVLQKWFNSWGGIIRDALSLLSDSVSSVFDLLDAKSELTITKLQNQIDEVNERHEKAVEAYEAANERVKAIQEELNDADATRSLQLGEQLDREIQNRKKAATEEKKLAKEKEKLEKQMMRAEYEQKKAQSTASAIQAAINTASAIAVNLGSYPWPYSLIPVGIVTAMGVIQQATIATQRKALDAAYAGKFADGGDIEGPSHAQGGVNLNAEGGEYIINKKSTADNYALVDYINKANHPVTLSEVASLVGQGKDFQAQHKTHFATGGGVPEVSGGDAMSAILRRLDNMNFSPVVSVVDIINGTEQLTRVRDIAGAI